MTSEIVSVVIGAIRSYIINKIVDLLFAMKFVKNVSDVTKLKHNKVSVTLST